MSINLLVHVAVLLFHSWIICWTSDCATIWFKVLIGRKKNLHICQLQKYETSHLLTMKHISKTLRIEKCKLDTLICKHWVWIMFKRVQRMRILIYMWTNSLKDRSRTILSVIVSTQSNFLRYRGESLSRNKHNTIYLYVRLKFK